MKNDERLKPLDFALKLEEAGREFYLAQARKMTNEIAQRVFLSIADEELKHIERIHKIYEAIEKDGDTEKSGWENIRIEKGHLDNIFKATLKEELKERSRVPEDEAIKGAMENERCGYNFYQKISQETADKGVKSFFQALMKEEDVHFDILQRTYEYLFDTADWYVELEGRIVEGG